MSRWLWLAVLAGCSTDVAPTTVGDADVLPEIADPITADSPAAMFDGPRDGPDVMVMVDSVSWVVDPDTQAVLEIPVGAAMQTHVVGEDPTRLLRVGDHVFVTVRGVGEVVRLDRRGDAWVEGARRYVGAEPYGVAMSNHRDTLWVSLSMEDALVELDPVSLEELRRVTVPHEPRGLAVSPADAKEVVYVASGGAAELHRVDSEGAVVTEPLPDMPRYIDPGCPDYLLEARITGDPQVTGDGSRVVVPALYVDTHIDEVPLPTDSLDNPIAAPNAECRRQAAAPVYGVPADIARPARVDRFNPALVVSDEGTGERRVMHLGTRTDCGEDVVRSYPYGVELYDSGDDHMAVVAVEGTGNLITVSLDPSGAMESSFHVAEGKASCGPVGLRGLVKQEGRVWGWSFLLRELTAWDVQADGMPQRDAVVSQTAVGFDAVSRDLGYGRLLFYSATRVEMAAGSSGVSCAACHVDGRADGLTWHLPEGPRQTPSLAGHVASTAPMTWTGDVPTVEEEVLRTASGRMGGTGGVLADRQAVAAFVNATRAVELPRAEDPALVALGETLFRSEEVGCATCHVGSAGTDNANHVVAGFDEATNTPPLTGILGTPPYLHDGSAPTLMDVLLRARDGSMGDTSGLSDHELDALVAYLRTR